MNPLKRLGPTVAMVNTTLTMYDKVVLAHLSQQMGVTPPNVFRMYLRRVGRSLEKRGILKCERNGKKVRWYISDQ